MINERQIAQQSLSVLKKTFDIVSQEDDYPVETKQRRFEIDSLVQAKYGKSRIDLKFGVEIAEFLNKKNLKGKIDRIEQLSDAAGGKVDFVLLVTYYIPEKMREHLRSKGINYYDGSGNIHIRCPKVYIFVEGIGQVEQKEGFVEKERVVINHVLKLKTWNLKGVADSLNVYCEETCKYTSKERRRVCRHCEKGASSGQVFNTFTKLKEGGYIKQDQDSKVYEWEQDGKERLKASLAEMKEHAGLYRPQRHDRQKIMI